MMMSMMMTMMMTMMVRRRMILNDGREKTALSDRGDELGKLCQQEKTRTSAASFKLQLFWEFRYSMRDGSRNNLIVTWIV